MPRMFLAGASAALALSLSPVLAAPAGPHSAGPIAVEDSLVTKVHGFHQHCAEGRFSVHRHVPGVGQVQCGGGPVYRGPPVYAPAPPVYRGPPGYRGGGLSRDDYCAVVYNQCYARFGRGNAPYFSCMRRQGC